MESSPPEVTGLKKRVNVALRNAIGLTQNPLPICLDPNVAYTPIDATSRVVHGDLAPMVIGGLASLFLQMLHPRAMAGVAQHSRYQDDPFGRMLQTANFIGATTYGTKSSATKFIKRVRQVHLQVVGVTDQGEPYEANDPTLLSWVHCAEIAMFYRAYELFGKHPLREGEDDQYVAEMAHLADDLGCSLIPYSAAALHQALEGFRPELELRADGRHARDFLQNEIVQGRLRRFIFWFLLRSAYSILPPWAREMLGVKSTPLMDRFFVRPATRFLSAGIRVAVPPMPRSAL